MSDKRKQTYYLQNGTIYELLPQYYHYSTLNLPIHDYFKPFKSSYKPPDILGNSSYYSQRGSALNIKIRILNGLFDQKKIDVKANKKQIVSDFAFQQVSEYFWLPAGNCHLDIFETADKTKKILDNELNFEAGKSYTVVIAGKSNNIRLIIIENQAEVPKGETKIRFVHLSIRTPALDLAVKARDVVFPNVSYLHATEYLGLTPMTVDLELRTAGSKQVIFPMPKLTFTANDAYTLIFWGSDTKLQIIND